MSYLKIYLLFINSLNRFVMFPRKFSGGHGVDLERAQPEKAETNPSNCKNQNTVVLT